MKKRLLFLLAFLVTSWSLFGDNVTEEQARKKAIDFFRSNTPALNVTRLDMVYDGERPSTGPMSLSEPAFYVFDNPDGKGFVIVSGDDMAYPVLGYSFENDFETENMPPHVKAWLDGMAERINYVRAKGYEGYERPVTQSSVGDVVVQLQTAKWNQGAPYNNLIPEYQGQHCYTGCTATATCIVMRYHRHPNKGVGTIPSYVTEKNSMSIPAITLGHTYDWSNMPLEYTSSSTTTQNQAVATLMRDISCVIESDFGLYGTGAYAGIIPEKLATHFGYDKGALYNRRVSFSNSEWHTIIQGELDLDRPVLYTGFNSSSGHAFVLDGYTTDDYFSVNWGWGGYCDGYFLLDAMYPSGSGIGGNDDHYNFNQCCITGFIPDAGGEYEWSLRYFTNGLSTDETVFESGKTFSVQVKGLGNAGNALFTGKFGLFLVDEDGNQKELLSEAVITSGIGMYPGSYYTALQFEMSIDGSIDVGDRIIGYYQLDGSDEWVMVKGGEECVCELLVGDTETIRESTSITYNKVEKVVVITTKSGVTVKLFDSSSTDKSSLCVVDGNTVTLSTEGLPADTYLVRLSKGSEVEEVKIKLN